MRPADERPSRSGAPGRPPIPRQVLALGWVSLLTDAASDMVYPLLPQVLAGMAAGPAALGMVEAVAEIVATASRFAFGSLSDRSGRRKPFVVAGYGIAALARPLLALATASWQVALVRATDRLGKGLRGPARDALLAAATDAGSRGTAFAVHRMMDNLGSALGPILAFVLLGWAKLDLATVIVLSAVPGLLSMLVALVAVRETPSGDSPGSPPSGDFPGSPAAEPGTANPASTGPALPLPAAAKRYLVAFGVFSLAGSADAFLLQRLLDLGLRAAFLPLAWVSLQLAKALVNVPGGRMSDRFGHRRVLLAAWSVYALAYGAFGLAGSVTSFWIVLIAYAIYYGLSEGGQRALLADLVPVAARGRAFGVQQTVEGLMVVPANLGFGWVYATYGATAAFGAGAVTAVVAVLALAGMQVGERGKEQAPHRF